MTSQTLLDSPKGTSVSPKGTIPFGKPLARTLPWMDNCVIIPNLQPRAQYDITVCRSQFSLDYQVQLYPSADESQHCQIILCVCVCVCVRAHARVYTYMMTHSGIYSIVKVLGAVVAFKI